ncbi:ORF106 [Ranid herpesvirus 2]|uniref:mitogen-activated protein kinase kinase n=1 Tax=Ranid herpesvirus 2 TaxID=389214 RepID=Q14W00_9VIRU|nr:ORF106 [Ranid herpesvirus 2]ABG25589.1 ORF106 [Ranid herpesvirus 2]
MSINHPECIAFYNTLHNFSNNDCMVGDLAINVIAKSTDTFSQIMPYSNQNKCMTMINYDAVKPVRAQPTLVAALANEDVKEPAQRVDWMPVYFDVHEKPIFKGHWVGCFNNNIELNNEISVHTVHTISRFISKQRPTIWASDDNMCKRTAAKNNCHEMLANMLCNCVYIHHCTYSFFSKEDIFMYSPTVALTAHHYFSDSRRAKRRTQALSMFFHILRGLYYLNEKLGIAHCDVKLSNILYDSKGERIFKLCDLGSALPINQKGRLMGTLPNVAPEILEAYCGSSVDFEYTDVLVTPKVDVWALGLIVQEIMEGDFYASALSKGHKQKQLFRTVLTRHKKNIAIQRAAESIDVFNYISKLCIAEENERPVPETVLRLFGCFNNFFQHKILSLEKYVPNQVCLDFLKNVDENDVITPTYKMVRVPEHEMNSVYAVKAALEGKVVRTLGTAAHVFHSLLADTVKRHYKNYRPKEVEGTASPPRRFRKMSRGSVEEEEELTEKFLQCDMEDPGKVLNVPLEDVIAKKSLPGLDVFRNKVWDKDAKTPRYGADINCAVMKLFNCSKAYSHSPAVTQTPFCIPECEETACLYWEKNLSGRYVTQLPDTRKAIEGRAHMCTAFSTSGGFPCYMYNDIGEIADHKHVGVCCGIDFYSAEDTHIMSMTLPDGMRSLGQILDFMCNALRPSTHPSMLSVYGFMLCKKHNETRVLVICEGKLAAGDVPNFEAEVPDDAPLKEVMKSAADHLHAHGLRMYISDQRFMQAFRDQKVFNYGLVLLMLLGCRVSFGERQPTGHIREERVELRLPEQVPEVREKMVAVATKFGHVKLGDVNVEVNVVCARSFV